MVAKVALGRLEVGTMFPVGDDRGPGAGIAVVTIALIILNVLAFFLELGQGSEGALQSFISAWGVVPREFSVGRDLPPLIPVPYWSTLITSMFLHAGWMHLGGNMLYLWIFGDNIERAMGSARYLAFYLICGIAAGLAHIAFSAGSPVPSLGASGAISGVLGGYLVMFPQNRVRVLTRAGMTSVPAIVVLGFWIVIQLFSQIGSIAQTSDGGGVATWPTSEASSPDWCWSSSSLQDGRSWRPHSAIVPRADQSFTRTRMLA